MPPSMDSEFAFFIEELGFGPPEHTRPVPGSAIAHFRGKLPDQWLTYWQQHGWSSYGKGLLWTVDPSEYESVVQAWLEGTPLLERDRFYAVARSAFGTLFLCGEHSGQSVRIDAPSGMIFPSDKSDMVRAGRQDLMVRLFLVQMTKKALDEEDVRHRPLFERARKVLGPLGPGEMYGFEPALVAGGQARLENLRKVDAVTHLRLLAQFGDRQIMRDVFQDARDAGLM